MLKAKELESLIPVVNDGMGEEAALHEGWDWEEIREIPNVGSQSGLLAWREDSHPMSQPCSLWFSAVSQREPAKVLPPLTH